MTLKQLYGLLASTSFPVAYQSWKAAGVEPPPMPYIVYSSDGNDDFRADNSQYVEIQDISVELYTETRNLSAESVLEQILRSAGIVFDKTISYVDDEKMFQIDYEFQI